MSLMKQIRIDKVTLNIGVGVPGDKLEKAIKLLQVISQSKPVRTKTEKRIPTWGLRPNLQIAAKVTIRGKKADLLLARLLKAVENKIALRKFDNNGNFSFGIPEYIDIPGVNYDPVIGVIGLEAAVTLARPGFRIKNRNVMKKKIPKRHIITKQEAVKFVKEKYSVNVGDEE